MSSTADFDRLRKELNRAEREEEMRGKGKIFTKILLTVFFVIVGIIAVGGIAVLAMRIAGGNSLKKTVAGQVPVLTDDTSGKIETLTEDDGTWQEGYITFNGKTYVYKEDILTFLVLGVDKDGEAETTDEFAGGGQSDGIFLVVCDPEDKAVKVIAVNRDTIVPIKMPGGSLDGSDAVTHAQLSTQYGFGDGGESSCELVKETVSDLFCGLPISGYASIRMTAVPIINDAVDGVSVTVNEDMTKAKKGWNEGETIDLHGQDAYTYVRWRNKDNFESARMRLDRQKRFLSAFITKARAETKKDITLPVKIFNEISDYMVTDFTASEVAYMASEYLGYSFDASSIITLEGETKQGEKFEEFYPDEDKLKEMMIEVFYKEVN